MKKFIIILLMCLIQGIAFADTNIKEERLDLKSLNNNLLKNRPTADDPRLKSIYDDDTKMEGMDYMYRQQQKMMQPQTWNPYGGFRY